MPPHQGNSQAINSFQLQQFEMVKFLYDRFSLGMQFTLFVSLVAVFLAYFELSLQGRFFWAVLWFLGLCLIQAGRFYLKTRFDVCRNDPLINPALWRQRFVFGVYLAAAWQGLGALVVMPYISENLQFIYHVFLLGLGAGAIAYLATSLLIYGSYLILMILPVTVYLIWSGTPDGIILACMYLFMISAYFLGVKRMNSMIAEALHLRFDNEVLVNDLQRLLQVVASSNKELNRFSTTDDLTGASNFRAFRVRLEEQRRKHLESNLPLSIVMVNIDFYHEYNECYGQEKANQTLKTIAQLLIKSIIHKEEMVARVNGAEFGLIIPGVACEGARMIMQGVMSELQSLSLIHEKSRIGLYLTLSAGICCVPVTEGLNSRDLLSRADDALRLAKKNGRNRIEVVNA